MTKRKIEILESFYHKRPAMASAIAIPAVFSLRFHWGVERRRILAFGAIFIALAAAASYVVAINFMVFDGRAIEKDNAVSASLEHENALLARSLAEHQSPAWLVEQSRANGMVAVGSLRYLSADAALAFSR